MQKLATGLGVVAMLASTSVFAADLAVKAPPPPPPAVWNWSGFYIGAGGSLNWAHFDQSLERSVTAVFLIRHRPIDSLRHRTT